MQNHKTGCNDCCSCGKKCKCGNGNGEFAFKFSGVSGIAEAGSTFSFLADRGLGTTIGNLSAAVRYPLDKAFLALGLAVNVGPVPQGATLSVALVKNGTVVPNTTINYGGANPASGKQTLNLNSISFAAGDDLDLQVTTTGLITTPINVSATVRGKYA